MDIKTSMFNSQRDGHPRNSDI